MIINDLHVVGVLTDPFKANPPLIVDSDAVLSLPITAQLFKSIGKWNQQIIEFFGGVQVAESA